MEAVTIREHSVSELLELGKHFKQAMGESLAALLVKLTDAEADRISLSTVPVEKKCNCSFVLETKASYEVMQGP